MLYYAPVNFTRSSEIVKLFARIANEVVNDSKTLNYLLSSIHTFLIDCPDNVREFCQIDGSVEMLIDVLAPSLEEEDYGEEKNREEYTELCGNAIRALMRIAQHFNSDEVLRISRLREKVFGIFAEKNIRLVLAHHRDRPQISHLDRYINQMITGLLLELY